jgi:hypothetical protein
VKTPEPGGEALPGTGASVPSLWELGEPVYEQNGVVRECSRLYLEVDATRMLWP